MSQKEMLEPIKAIMKKQLDERDQKQCVTHIVCE